MNKIVITKLNDIMFLLVYENDHLAECHPLCEDNALRIGSIYIGRVEKVVKNLQSAFIRLDKDNVGYLPLDDKPALVLNRKLEKGLSSIAQNDLVLVQVAAEPQKQKQARVTGNIGLVGQYVALDLNAGKSGISKKITNKPRTSELKSLLESLSSYDGKDLDCGAFPAVDGSVLANHMDSTETAALASQYGIILRTACEQASDSDIIAEFQSLTATMERLIHKAAFEKKTGCIYAGLREYQKIIEEYGIERIQEIQTDIVEVYEALSNSSKFSNRSILTFYENTDYPLSKLLSLKTQVERLLNKKVWLKSGGFLVIEPTEAMVVVDVNSGKSIGKKKKETHIFETNMEAAGEITRQLRLRNLSGIIMIDFINMENAEYKDSLVSRLKQGLAYDKIPSVFVDITKLEVFEMTRKKVRRPLHEVIFMQKDEIFLR